MRKIISFSVLLAAITGFFACSNDFDLTNKWKDIPVVYGLLDASDSAQYIRIEKAFLDPETSAITVAQISDSIYYQNLTVSLKEIETSGSVTQSIPLGLVDGNLDGYPKEEGTFSNEPNWLYKTTQALDTKKDYRLVILNGEKEITAETGIIGEFEVFTPSSSAVLDLKRNGNFNVGWRMDPISGDDELDDAHFFDLYGNLFYNEFPIGNPSEAVVKSARWTIAKSIKNNGDNTIRQTVSNNAFYDFVAQSIDPAPGMARCFISLDFEIVAAGEELLNYIEVGQANFGITGSNGIPDYTNISEGKGVFSTRYTLKYPGTQVSNGTKDSLSFGSITAGLGFIKAEGICP